MTDKRVQFDFEIDFSNGGGIQGQAFRLDIDGEDIADEDLADFVVRDLRLLMVGAVRILNKTIVAEPHKRAAAVADARSASARFVDLSHTIEDGMITYKGLPAPLICDHLSRAPRALSTRPARNSRSARSRWSRTPAPTSIAPSIATRTARTSPISISPRSRRSTP